MLEHLLWTSESVLFACWILKVFHCSHACTQATKCYQLPPSGGDIQLMPATFHAVTDFLPGARHAGPGAAAACAGPHPEPRASDRGVQGTGNLEGCAGAAAADNEAGEAGAARLCGRRV